LEVNSVLSTAAVDRLRVIQGDGYPVLSVYLGLKPGVGTLRALPTRLKDLLAPLADPTADLTRDQRMSLRADVDSLFDLSTRISGDLGRGVAVFKCSAIGLDEYLSLPGPVRDRAVVNTSPYVRPLDAMLEHYHRFAVVVIERRRASIFRFSMDHLEAWEELSEEEIRKANWGGFAGYEERRVRSRTEEIAGRHYRDVSARLYGLWRGVGFDLVALGGPQEHVEGLQQALHPDLVQRLAGTFTIDPGTMTPALVLEHTTQVADEYERRHALDAVARLLDTAQAGGTAVVGIEETVTPVNRKAVDLLFVQGTGTVAGSACSQCGELATNGAGRLCPRCGGERRAVPDLLDAMAEAVRSSGGKVQHVLTDTPLREYQVGAALRYALEPRGME
jgi:peptide chain release factor subunit 1